MKTKMNKSKVASTKPLLAAPRLPLTPAPSRSRALQRNGESTDQRKPSDEQALARAKAEDEMRSVIPWEGVLKVEAWPQAVDGSALLDALAQLLRRFVVLPTAAENAMALWILHTYAF